MTVLVAEWILCEISFVKENELVVHRNNIAEILEVEYNFDRAVAVSAVAIGEGFIVWVSEKELAPIRFLYELLAHYFAQAINESAVHIDILVSGCNPPLSEQAKGEYYAKVLNELLQSIQNRLVRKFTES